jgi:hypothetical protein
MLVSIETLACALASSDFLSCLQTNKAQQIKTSKLVLALGCFHGKNKALVKVLVCFGFPLLRTA